MLTQSGDTTGEQESSNGGKKREILVSYHVKLTPSILERLRRLRNAGIDARNLGLVGDEGSTELASISLEGTSACGDIQDKSSRHD